MTGRRSNGQAPQPVSFLVEDRCYVPDGGGPEKAAIVASLGRQPGLCQQAILIVASQTSTTFQDVLGSEARSEVYSQEGGGALSLHRDLERGRYGGRSRQEEIPRKGGIKTHG